MSNWKLKVVSWGQNVPDRKSIQVNLIDHFEARGMTPLYGRGDHILGGGMCHMDMWINRNGRVLARFWSRRGDVDEESYEVTGMRSPAKPIDKKFDEAVVPAKLRKRYDNWIISYS